MKMQLKLLSTTFLLFLYCLNISAQRNDNFTFIAGLSLNTEYLYKDYISNKTNSYIGVFGEIQLGKRLSFLTSVSLSERNLEAYNPCKNRDCGGIDPSLPPTIFSFDSYTYTEKAWTIEHLLKVNIINKKVTHFLGAGGLWKIPTKAYSDSDNLYNSETMVYAPSNSSYLNLRFGIQFATGVDYDLSKNIKISTQINWNIYSSYFFAKKEFFLKYYDFNPNNLNIRLNVGYIF